jgi:type I restriction-modification system DNA methylase subunit
LGARAKAQTLKADFEAYLDGFSPIVQEILDKFKFRNQIPTMVVADILGSIIEKFLGHSINLGHQPVLSTDGTERLHALDNHAMGTIFEELIRREVLPHVPDAWIDKEATKIGYEISFIRHFYKPQPLRTLAEISADILPLEKETGGLLGEIVGSAKP